MRNTRVGIGWSMAQYGHRIHGTGFRPVLQMSPSGIRVRGRAYAFSDLIRVTVTPRSWFLDLFFRDRGHPRAVLFFRDGRFVRIDGGTLEREFIPWTVDPETGATEAFTELLGRLRRECAHAMTPLGAPA